MILRGGLQLPTPEKSMNQNSKCFWEGKIGHERKELSLNFGQEFSLRERERHSWAAFLGKNKPSVF